MAYCVTADLYSYGLPRGALASPGVLVGTVSTADDTLELDGHGFDDGTTLQFRAVGGGTLPAPIVAGVDYYAIVVDAWRFQIAAISGGAAIDLTSTGTTFVVMAPLPIAATIEKVSRLIDDMLPAHVVPLTDPVAPIIRMTTAELAAAELLALTGKGSVSLTAIYDAARKRVERWSRNVEIRGTNAPPTAQRTLRSSAALRPLTPWKRYGGIA